MPSNDRIADKSWSVFIYSMLVAILPCYNQYQVPQGTWYSNPALERLP